MKSISIAKPGQGCINEDFALANEHVLAISDGAEVEVYMQIDGQII